MDTIFIGIKNFLKPTFFKIFVFISVGIVYLYLAKESVSAAGFNFAFYYNAYGFPLQYFITGDTDKIQSMMKDLFLGEYFIKYGNVLLNPAALILNVILIYIFSCLMAILFNKFNANSKSY